MRNKDKIFIGFDIGSVSVKGVVVDSSGELIYTRYERSFGQPSKVADRILKDIVFKYPDSEIEQLGATGTGGSLIASILGGVFVNEIVAQSKTVLSLYPQVRTLVEMGGEDSKMIRFKEENGKLALGDFAMNNLCAAGTGSFLDQQASRMGYQIAEEFGAMALKAKRVPRIAGRCSVFAKSDMIHLQQVGAPDYEIIAGLCAAVARSFISNVAKGKEFTRPVGFFGGVSSNVGVAKALADELQIPLDEIVIPEHNRVSGAIGAALTVKERVEPTEFKGVDAISVYLAELSSKTQERNSMPKLDSEFNDSFYNIEKLPLSSNGSKTKCFIGIDIGSLSTNVVAINEDSKVIARRYLRTQSRPIEAVTRGLKELGEEIGDKVEVVGVGTTGSGRYMIGDFVGADVVRNEITAQATASIESNPEVDTIFEIGGQDSKYISIENGAVVDFEMNKVCAAGTGSFIEEQSEKFNLKIEDEFADTAFRSSKPGKFGDRCTVFIESDLVANQQKGLGKEDLAAGLSYSIVTNYLNRVVGPRKVGNNLLFQGGVAWNKAVVSAFGSVTGKKVTVPAHHDVTGAIGVAIIARRMFGIRYDQTKFHGFDLAKREYKVTTFECKACDNVCGISRVKFDKEPHYYGARCDLFDSKSAAKSSDRPDFVSYDLFSERERYLFGDYLNKKNFERSEDSKKIRIGIPRVLYFHEHFPFWSKVFEKLGFEVVLSGKTNHTLIKEAIGAVKAETCFPIKIIYGHAIDLLKKEVDYIFLPSTITANNTDSKFKTSQTCPMVQASPYLLDSAIDFTKSNVKVISCPLYFQKGPKILSKELYDMLRENFDIKKSVVEEAIREGIKAQDHFTATIKARGKEVIDDLKKRGDRPVVIISRAYNGSDSGLNLDLPRKLLAMGKIAIPMDFLDTIEDEVIKSNPDMYWRSGQRMLATADYIKNDPMVDAILLSSFNCGPDSFIHYHIEDRLKGKPILSLEIDEHSADAGAITRCEAYFDSLDNIAAIKVAKQNSLEQTDSKMECGAPIIVDKGSNGSSSLLIPKNGTSVVNRDKDSKAAKKQTKLYIPYMCDHGYPLAAVLRREGIYAEVLPVSDQSSIDIGMKYATGKECIPFVMTTGDIMKKAKEPGFDAENSAFFMPTTNGPCRFGQYKSVQRMFLSTELGKDIPLVSPNSDSAYSQGVSKALEISSTTKVRRDMWRGSVAVDAITKLLHRKRPYELNPGETESAYKTSLDEIVSIIENGSSDKLFPHMRLIADRFRSIKISNEKKPVIGVVGEIYVRNHQFSNQDVVKRIESLGGEARISPFAEWLLYCNNRSIENAKYDKKYLEQFKAYVQDIVQKKDEKQVYEPLHDMIGDYEDGTIYELLEHASAYLDKSFEGEAILSIGKAIEFVRSGVSGIVSVVPFSCMPGTIVAGISDKLRGDLGGVPWLNLDLDGVQDSGSQTRLEAFMYQAAQFGMAKV